MTSFIGNNIKPKGVGLIPPNKVISGGYRSIIGNGSGLFSSILSFNMLSYSGLSPTYFTANDTTVLFGTGVPPIRTIGGLEYLLVEGSDSTVNSYSEQLTGWAGTGVQSGLGEDALANPLGVVTANYIKETAVTDIHRIRIYNVAFISGTKYILKIHLKAIERGYAFLSMFPTAFPGDPTIWCNSISGVTTSPVSVDWSYISNSGNGWYSFTIGLTADTTTTGNFLCYFSPDGVITNYLGVIDYGCGLWGFNVVKDCFCPRSLIYCDGSPGTFMGNEPMFYELDIPAWVRSGFEFDIIPEWSTAIAAAYGAHLYLFSISATAGSMDCYFDGADSKIHLDVGGVEQAITSALTWSMDQKITVRVQFDDGANSSIIVSGATAGNGTYTGTQCAAADGDLAWGIRHTTNDLHGYIRISRPRKL